MNHFVTEGTCSLQKSFSEANSDRPRSSLDKSITDSDLEVSTILIDSPAPDHSDNDAVVSSIQSTTDQIELNLQLCRDFTKMVCSLKMDGVTFQKS